MPWWSPVLRWWWAGPCPARLRRRASRTRPRGNRAGQRRCASAVLATGTGVPCLRQWDGQPGRAWRGVPGRLQLDGARRRPAHQVALDEGEGQDQGRGDDEHPGGEQGPLALVLTVEAEQATGEGEVVV